MGLVAWVLPSLVRELRSYIKLLHAAGKKKKKERKLHEEKLT